VHTTFRIRKTAAAWGTLALIATLSMIPSAATPRFYDDDPVWRENDTEDASSIKPLEINLMVDLAYNLLATRALPASRARNLNTVDEVPDSSWFTNRIGRHALTAEDITTGPNTTTGPAPGTWTVIASKSDGITPGFTVKDPTGQVWFVKFDPPGYRGMSTGTEVAATKLMWALGYHVPENHIAYLRADQLVVGEGAKFTPLGGSRRLMRRDDIEKLLQRADQEPDGSYRIVASKALPGTPVGRIRFRGTRPDDPNDIVPHEDRRELRAYGVFAAWLNHVDAKALNSLDMLVNDNGRKVVRHYLIDFGSSLGSGAVEPAHYSAGSGYYIEPGTVGRQMIGFGFIRPKWHTAQFYTSSSIGRLPLDNTRFNPAVWKPRVPNQAFLQARADDQFWAAQKLAAMSTDLIRAAVHAGEFADPAAEEFLVTALTERRDAILQAYLAPINPIADPAIDENGTLTFRNAAVDADLAPAPHGYRAVWSTFDNTTAATQSIGETFSTAGQMHAPRTLSSTSSAFIKVSLTSTGAPHAAWELPVDAYFRRTADGWRLVGFERLPESGTTSGAQAAASASTRSR
jgi:hypothetical protein